MSIFGKMFIRCFLLLFVATIMTKSALSDEVGAWKLLEPKMGRGAMVCNKSEPSYACFMLRCFADRKLQFAFHFNAGKYAWDPIAEIRIDGGRATKLAFQTMVEGMWIVSPIETADSAALIQAMRKGGAFTFDIGYRHQFSLRGFSKTIDAAIARCDAPVIKDDIPKVTAKAGEPASSGPRMHLHWNKDIWGHDIDSGRTNPELAGLTWQQCSDHCSARPACHAFTHNGNNNVCILKSAGGEVSHSPGATSGVLSRSQPESPVALRGAHVTVAEDLDWRKGDTPQTYIARIREAAASKGGTCEAERSEAASIAKSVKISTDPAAKIAGITFAVRWSGEALSNRIPLYLVFSSNSPIRFAGKGFFALTPKALAPFGIETDAERIRAFVPLFRSVDMRNGEVGITPLSAGPLGVSVSAVAYLRKCREAVVLRREELVNHITPGTPQIALRDPVARNDYPKRIDIPSYGRGIRFNGQRFMLLDNKEGEIIERDGTDILLSPTSRFFTFSSNGQFHVMDALDGAVVAVLPGNDVSWLSGDSFVISTAIPWGSIWLASTLKSELIVDGGKTSCASCSAEGSSRLDINLENGLAIVAGPLGYTFAVLDDPQLKISNPNLITADEGLRGSKAFFRTFIDQIGPVSPIGFGLVWNTPEGILRTHPEATANENSETTLSRNYVTTDSPPHSRRSLLDALGEFSFAKLEKEVVVAPLIKPHALAYDAPEREEADRRMNVDRVKIREAMTRDLKSWGVKVNWARRTGDFVTDLHCQQFEDGNGDLAEDVDLAYRLVDGKRIVWVVRTSCSGGATYGTLSTQSQFAIFDSRKPVPAAEGVIDSHSTMGNVQGDPPFYESDFQTKLIGGRWVVIYTPAGGRITVYDLETRKIVFKINDIERGDLLQNVHLEANGRHLLQVNGDNSFVLYEIQTSQPVLRGRYVDSEIVFWNRDYFFDSSAEGADLVHLKFPGHSGQFSFQQFDARLRASGLLARILRGSFAERPFQIPAPPDLEGKPRYEKGRITGSVTVRGLAPIEDVMLFQDGIKSKSFTPSIDGTVNIDAQRKPGARWATIVARDRNGLTSAPLSVDLGADPISRSGVRFLGIGVDKYRDPALAPFGYAKSDVSKFSQTLHELSGSSIDLKSSDVLVDGWDTPVITPQAAIEAAERLVHKLEEDETAVVFFSGHGLRSEKTGELYLATTETNQGDLENTALSWNRLSTVLSRARGRMLVLLDACRSSVAGTRISASNDEAVGGLRAAIPTGLVVISASKGRENSLESEKFDSSGVFAYALKQAIVNERAATDLNNNGAIEAMELFAAVKYKVMELRDGQQTPWLSRNQLVGDFALF